MAATHGRFSCSQALIQNGERVLCFFYRSTCIWIFFQATNAYLQWGWTISQVSLKNIIIAFHKSQDYPVFFILMTIYMFVLLPPDLVTSPFSASLPLISNWLPVPLLHIVANLFTLLIYKQPLFRLTVTTYFSKKPLAIKLAAFMTNLRYFL